MIIILRATSTILHPLYQNKDRLVNLFDLKEVALPHWFSWNVLRMMWIQQDLLQSIMDGILTCHVAYLLERNCESIKLNTALIQVAKENISLMASEEDSHQDARHSWISPPAHAVTIYAENCTPICRLSFFLLVWLACWRRPFFVQQLALFINCIQSAYRRLSNMMHKFDKHMLWRLRYVCFT